MLRFVFSLLLVFPLLAQDRVGTIQVRVATDHSDWRYEPGQPVRFRIVATRDGHALTGAKVNYKIGPEMMPAKIDQSANLTADGLTVNGGTMNEPGFLRCIATVEENGKTYRGLATAAFHPEAIKPTQQDPASDHRGASSERRRRTTATAISAASRCASATTIASMSSGSAWRRTMSSRSRSSTTTRSAACSSASTARARRTRSTT